MKRNNIILIILSIIFIIIVSISIKKNKYIENLSILNSTTTRPIPIYVGDTNQCPGWECNNVGDTCGNNENNPTFVCINETRDGNQCNIPPCWFSTNDRQIPKQKPQYVGKTNQCTGWRCNFVGDTCGYDINNPQYICVNKSRESDQCNNPPCWFSINDKQLPTLIGKI